MGDGVEELNLNELNEQEIKELEDYLVNNKQKEEISLKSLVKANREPKRAAPVIDLDKLRNHMKDEALKEDFSGKNYVEFKKKPRKEVNRRKVQNNNDDDMELMSALMTADHSELSQICSDMGLDSKLIEELTDPIVKCGLSFPKKEIYEEPDNPVDLSITLEKIAIFDSSITSLILNNHPDMNPEFALALFENLANQSCTIERLEMANCQLTDVYIAELTNSMKTNKSLKSLNVETNYITSKTMLNLINVLIDNETLEELKICNQNSSLGFEVDNALVNLVEKNPRIKKISHEFHYNEPKDRFEKNILKNVYKNHHNKIVDLNK